MQIALVEPQIPQNTGSIARTCAAMQIPLHLVGKLGFDISEKAIRRAGLDYWPYVTLTHHESWSAYREKAASVKLWAISKYGKIPYYEACFKPDDALVFGSETSGLGRLLNDFAADAILCIPLKCPHVRSLNLSNAVSIVLLEALRQINYFGTASQEPS
jgi:tRNA (cytidine/uridine-2'-O-)-methyltransferase